MVHIFQFHERKIILYFHVLMILHMADVLFYFFFILSFEIKINKIKEHVVLSMHIYIYAFSSEIIFHYASPSKYVHTLEV